MSSLTIENKEVHCSCFPIPSFDLATIKKPIKPEISGLYHPKSRQAKSALVKSSETSHARKKRSLKREKPNSARHYRSDTNHIYSFENQTKKIGRLSEREKYLLSDQLNAQLKCHQKQIHQSINTKEKQKPKQRKTLRGNPQNLSHKPIFIQSIPLRIGQNEKITPEEQIFSQNLLRRSSVPSQKILEKEKKQMSLFNEKKFQYSIPIQKSENKPNDRMIIFPKEAESIIDEQNFQDDKVSEVLGWSRSPERFKPGIFGLGQKSTKIQTLLMTGSNTKNSSTGKNSLIEQDQYLFRSKKS